MLKRRQTGSIKRSDHNRTTEAMLSNNNPGFDRIEANGNAKSHDGRADRAQGKQAFRMICSKIIEQKDKKRQKEFRLANQTSLFSLTLPNYHFPFVQNVDICIISKSRKPVLYLYQCDTSLFIRSYLLPMKTLIVLAIICTLTLQQTVLVASSTSNTLITSPSSATINVEPYHTSNNPGFIGYGAQWLWQASGSSWPNNYVNNFQSNFYASCNGSASLIIAADNVFSASINGGSAMTGNDWTRPQLFTIKVNCGLNTLVVNVTNKDKASPAALIFAVTQDPSICPNCTGALSYYDVNTCTCKCTQGCNCTGINKLYAWNDYPICGCKCAVWLKCPPNQYFNTNTCTCQCKPVSCLPGLYQDPKTCQCVKRCVGTCPSRMVWNSIECKCVCGIQCVSPYVLSPYNCQCNCPASNPNCNIMIADRATSGMIPI